MLLELEGVRAGYGDSVVLEDISLQVREGESVAVLGRNGVGKSTLMLTIMGFTRLSRGKLRWQGEDITRLPAHRRSRLGLGWVAQERDVFSSLTVEENLTATARPGRWNLAAVWRLFPRLQERRLANGNHLSGGEQQMLALGRALMTNPKLLLLDEPLEGLAPILVEELAAAIERMKKEEGMTLVLVEQHADVALSLTERAVILERGRIVHEGRADELRAGSEVLDRFMGLKLDAA